MRFALVAVVVLGCSGGGGGERKPPCAERPRCVVALGEVEIAQPAYRLLGSAQRTPMSANERKQWVMDRLVLRALLLEQAARAGIELTLADAEQAVKEGDLVIGGTPVAGQNIYFAEGMFDLRSFADFSRSLGLAGAEEMVAEQRSEHLAALAAKRVAPGGGLAAWFAERCAAALQSGQLTVNEPAYRCGALKE